MGVNIPVVVRLKGNNSVKAMEILNQNSQNIISEKDLSLAAQKAVELSK